MPINKSNDINENQGESVGFSSASPSTEQEVDLLKKDVENLQNEIPNIKEQFKKDIEKEREKLDDKIQNNSVRNIEALALFAAFFTFVAVNVQIFTQVQNLRSAMWFSVLLLGCLSEFALLVHVIVNMVVEKISIWDFIKRVVILFGLFGILIIIGLLTAGDEKLHKNNCDEIKIENQGANVEIHDNKLSALEKE